MSREDLGTEKSSTEAIAPRKQHTAAATLTELSILEAALVYGFRKLHDNAERLAFLLELEKAASSEEQTTCQRNTS